MAFVLLYRGASVGFPPVIAAVTEGSLAVAGVVTQEEQVQLGVAQRY